VSPHWAPPDWVLAAFLVAALGYALATIAFRIWSDGK
jgi:hypothetical protein